MEDQKSKKINLESIYEDTSMLKLVKYRLQIKRKEFLKNSEMLNLTKTDFAQQIDYWDILMYQVKELALDFHEERKWKKGIAYVLSNQIASKLKEKKSKMKLDELYKKSMCLFISMSVNYNYSDISMGKINKKMTKALNEHIKKVTNTESLLEEFANWKNKIRDIKNKLEKKYFINGKKAKNFTKIINLMENMILMQEEAVKRMKTSNQNKEDNLEHKSGNERDIKNSLENFIMDVEQDLSTNNKPEITYEPLPTITELEFLNINKEINSMMGEISEELGNYDILLNNPNCQIKENNNNITNADNLSNTNFCVNNKTNQNLNKSNLNLNISNNQNLLKIQIGNTRYLSPTKSAYENEILENINPKQLFYDANFADFEGNSKDNQEEKTNISIASPEKTNFEILKNYLEKFSNVDKVDMLHYYNYKKLDNFSYNKNFFYEDFEKVFSTVFKPIVEIDSNPEDRMLLENSVEGLKNRFDQVLNDPENLRIFNFKFDKFTILQKLISFWGLVNFGFSFSNILSEIPNIFSFSKSIIYENDEMVIYLKKILEEFKVDSYVSSFENIKFIDYDYYNNFCNRNTRALNSPEKDNTEINIKFDDKVNINEKFIYNLDPPMLNNFNWNFYYNKKIKEAKVNKIEDINNYLSKPYEEVSNSYPIISTNENVNNKESSYSNLALILNNPIFTYENKKKIFEFYKQYVKKLCEKVQILFNETQSKLQKYKNILPSSNVVNSNMNVNKNKQYCGFSINTEYTQLNKESLLADLNDYNENSIDPFSLDSFAEDKLKKTKPSNKQNIGVAFYSQNMINKEWEIMRNQWYQNNTQFKPKFRKYLKAINSNVSSNQNIHNNSSIPLLRSLNDSNIL